MTTKGLPCPRLKKRPEGFLTADISPVFISLEKTMSDQDGVVRWGNLFETRQGNFKENGWPYSASLLGNGNLLFSTSTLSQTDASVSSSSELALVQKRSEKSPDFSGEYTSPEEFEGHEPCRYKIAVWRKTVRNGQNEGQSYLRYAMTKIS